MALAHGGSHWLVKRFQHRLNLYLCLALIAIFILLVSENLAGALVLDRGGLQVLAFEVEKAKGVFLPRLSSDQKPEYAHKNQLEK